MSFRLLRMDDNGNQAVVATYTTREEAEQACRDFEARGHKQTYWVEGGACRQAD